MRKNNLVICLIVVFIFAALIGCASGDTPASSENHDDKAAETELDKSQSQHSDLSPTTSSSDIQDKEADQDNSSQQRVEFLINNQHLCESYYFTGNMPNIIGDIYSLFWIAPRGGAGITGEGQLISEKDDAVIMETKTCFEHYKSGDQEGWHENTEEEHPWIRLILTPSPKKEGVNEMAHKDMIIYTEGKDAYLAVQDPDNTEMWTVWKLSDYGSWFEKEIAMYLRIETGL